MFHNAFLSLGPTGCVGLAMIFMQSLEQFRSLLDNPRLVTVLSLLLHYALRTNYLKTLF